MKNIHNDIITEIDATEKVPFLLVEQYLDNNVTLRWVLAKENVTFGGHVYTARTFSIDDVEQSSEGQLDRLSVSFDNVDTSFDAYLDTYDFEGRTMMLKRVYLSGEVLPSNPSMYNEVFYGEMERPEDSDGKIVTISAVTGYALDKPLLNKFYGSFCQRKFGDKECTANLTDASHYYASGEALAGTTSHFSSSTLTQAENFWKFGTVKITGDSGVQYRRKVRSFSSNGSSGEVHLDINVLETITLGCDYEIEKGCDYTYQTCMGNNAWGPSGENILNFLGFIHIGLNRED